MVSSLGAIDPNTVIKVVKEVTAEEKKRQELMTARPSLDEIVNLHDFEVGTLGFRKIPRCLILCSQAVAKAILPAKAWAYYSSASDDEITIRENRAAYQRFAKHCYPWLTVHGF
jgi:L-lactate dehydrogenase (cytochrome)